MSAVRVLDASPSLAPPRRDPDRFELKYWLPEEVAAKVANWIAPHVVADRHGGPDAPVAQCNTSLYLESPNLVCYRRHIESAPDRFKLRVRVYGAPPAGTAFFETKRKVKAVIVKTRTAVPLQEAAALIDGSFDRLPTLSPPDQRHLEGFLYLQNVLRAEPVVLIRCWREAYASVDAHEDIRVTLDRQIVFQPARGTDFVGDPQRWSSIDGREQHGSYGPHVMLELKFPRRAPWWMRQLVNQLEAKRVGFSKYVAAIRTMQEAEARETDQRAAVPTRSY